LVKGYDGCRGSGLFRKPKYFVGKGKWEMKKVLIIFIILVGLYSLFNIVNNSFDWVPFGEKKENQATVTNQIEQIEIDVASLSTTIIPENRNSVKAELKGKGQLIVDKNGDKIVVKVKRPWGSWFSLFNFSKNPRLTIYVPEDYDRNMNIDLGSGNLKFSGPSKQQPMKLDELIVDIGSGNLELRNLEVTQLKHDGSSGNVVIDSIKAKNGTFDVSSGNLVINHYQGAVKADLSSGNLDLQMDKLTDSIDIDVSSGNVHLDLPDNADFTLRGDVGSGKITSDFPLTSKNLNSKNIQGKHGSGKYPINLDVSSGTIKIY
jgi:lia operon protein LiaG